MIHIQNFRKEPAGEWTKLIAEITYKGGGLSRKSEKSGLP